MCETEGNKQRKRPKIDYAKEFSVFVALAANVKETAEKYVGALAWAVIGILASIFLAVFFGTLSLFLCCGFRPLLLWLGVSFFMAVLVAFIFIFSVVLLRNEVMDFLSWLLRPRRRNEDSSTERAIYREFQPLGWGILFLTFWFSLITIPTESNTAFEVSWFFLAMSAAMLLSIWIPPFLAWLEKKAKKTVLIIASLTIFLAFYIGFLQPLGQMEPVVSNSSYNRDIAVGSNVASVAG